jgi:hypothetical protein
MKGGFAVTWHSRASLEWLARHLGSTQNNLSAHHMHLDGIEPALCEFLSATMLNQYMPLLVENPKFRRYERSRA